MIAIILAAGRSKRLQPLTDEIPKCLLKVEETTVLTRYLNLLEKTGIEKTIIVHGFNAQAVEEEVYSQKRGMEVEFVLNAEYETTTPIEGLLLVEEKIDDDFLLLNADIYFSETILADLIAHPKSCIGIDTKAPYIKNEMFVNFDERMLVTEISKSLEKKDSYQGKSVQVAKFLHADKEILFKRAREIAGKENIFYPAQAYDSLIQEKRFCVVDVQGEFSHELDTVEDYDSLMSKIGGLETKRPHGDSLAT